MDYERDTRLAYRNHSRAKSYKSQYAKDVSWARFTMWREQRFINGTLKQYNLKSSDKILDIPCGSGLLGKVFNTNPAFIVAADISNEMMNLAREDFKGENFGGFIQADITKTPFKREAFYCVISLGLMHRLPEDIRRQALREINFLSKRFAIVSYSIDSHYNRMKQWVIKKILPSYQPAPLPVSLPDVMEELNSNSFIPRKKFYIMPFLSAEVIFLLEKKY